MNATKNIQSVFRLAVAAIVFSLFFISCSSTKQAAKLNADDVKNMVHNKNFIFIADRVNPLRGRSRELTSEYDVSVKNDSLVSYLPYFGRAYQAPLDPSKGGIQFTSTSFSYTVTKNKGWNVTIKPNDFNEVQQFVFTIFDNGSATLYVTNTHKDPITFSGYVEKNQK